MKSFQLQQKEETLQDYKRVRVEEYVSAIVFGIGMFIFSGVSYTNIQKEERFSGTLFAMLAFGCGYVASASIQQIGPGSVRISELEREIEEMKKDHP